MAINVPGTAQKLADDYTNLGAYIGLTGVVAPETLEQAMRRLLPPYRAHHGDANARAIGAGVSAVQNQAKVAS